MNINNQINLSEAFFSEAELKQIRQLFSSNIFFQRKSIFKFEKLIENYLRRDKSVACLSSGTAAIHLALIQLGVKMGDEVLCQSFTFSASANPIVYQGAIPIFIDSEPNTWNMCPVALELAVKDRLKKGKKPKAIIVVHLYGMPADMHKILNVANKYEIPLIEDAAEALGSKYKNQKCGTFGDYGILSFNVNKIITTSGGGALICKDEEQKQKTIFLGTQARDNAPHYQHSQIGYNYRMSNVLAAIGCSQIEMLNNHIALRRANNQFYADLFQNTEGVKVFQEPDNDVYSNHWLSCILIDDSVTGYSKDDIRIELENQNIESRPLWKPLHLQSVFKDAAYYGDKVSENLFNKGLCLPSGSNLNDKDKDRITLALNSFM